MTYKKVFVTVGTTSFDELIKTVLSDDMLKTLSNKGFKSLTLQVGSCSLELNCKLRHGFDHIDYFHYEPSLDEYVKSADLIISHAGAGSIMDAMEASKPLIVVTNDSLMHNHQSELAEQLCENGHLYYCSYQNLKNVVDTVDLTSLTPYFVNHKFQKIAEYIDMVMGFT